VGCDIVFPAVINTQPIVGFEGYHDRRGVRTRDAEQLQSLGSLASPTTRLWNIVWGLGRKL